MYLEGNSIRLELDINKQMQTSQIHRDQAEEIYDMINEQDLKTSSQIHQSLQIQMEDNYLPINNQVQQIFCISLKIHFKLISQSKANRILQLSHQSQIKFSKYHFY
ncbi:hypothetical protein TTHERM_000573209 (macronuclear) [Tetrahymena thermophila SB210]|uniref:Uncharacterized protein n=1 Tax=Tetrahymena thermophila (strain SB210) TaxID=312017 RepID=W7XL66_TETTS|nr:hypothetical protein TTHERM_000573209 [Tetrahymena thermophila SB210]EWS75754.1 hypothetical protein TTHERM_000573209 [Tetrahymena thermophila SB210]|eukprot:XP_012651676.1 hypothetical protein TTHERM_000573209 [Tetrahymena thermophila SB210]